MANAKTQAQYNLGDIKDYVNYKGYDAQRQNAQDMYNSSIKSLEDKYNQLVGNINENRNQLSRDFASGRSTVANEYYDNRNLKKGSDLSSYLKSTGVGSLNNVLSRINLGNENSRLANTYYSGEDELNTQLGYINKDYDINRQNAKNTLNATMADIQAREKEAENDYNNKVASLAEQIQSRWDANANAQAALAEQKRYNNESLKNQMENYEQSFKVKLSEIAGSEPTEESFKNAVKYYMDVKGGTEKDAYDFLNSINIYEPRRDEEKIQFSNEGKPMYSGATIPAGILTLDDYKKLGTLGKWWYGLSNNRVYDTYNSRYVNTSEVK